MLTTWAHTDPHRVAGTSLTAILPIALVGAAAYYFASGTPQLDLPIAASLASGSSLGVVAGALIGRKTSERTLRMLIAGLLLVVGVKELYDVAAGMPTALHGSIPANLGLGQYLLIALGGLVIGILSGLVGLGGGIFIVPLLVIAFGLSNRAAQGTSLVAILPAAAIGAVIHHANGDVQVRTAGTIAAAGVPAAVAGALLALWLPQRALLGLFGVFLLFAAVRTWPRGGATREA
jgi:uncharacterized membrane protein YfcA